MKKKKKTFISLMLIFLLFISAVTPVFAAQKKITIKAEIISGYKKTLVGSSTGNRYTTDTDKLYVNGEVAFCIQSGWRIDGISSGTGSTNLTYVVSKILENDSLQNKIAYLGWYDSNMTNRDYAFTQMYIWQSLPDYPSSGNSNVKFVSNSLNNEYKEWKKGIDKKIDSWDTKPSFDCETNGETIDISAGETKTVTDSNGVLEDYKSFTYTEKGITVSHKEGANTMTVTAAKDCSEETVAMSKSLLEAAGCYKFDKSSAASYVYERDRSQDIAKYAEGFLDPIGMNLRFNVDIVKGKIAIEKTKSPDASSDEALAEEGAEFQIYLKSAGSYAASSESYRDVITTDKDGKATTKDLPHETYIVHQTKGAEGHKFIEDFEVTIGTDSHNKVYTYKVNNKTLQSKIKIVKKDAETGKAIPLTETSFELTNLTTGEHMKSDSEDGYFKTDENGEINLPFPLYYGSYRLTERKAPEGYVLAKSIEFTVDGSEEALTIEVKDAPQKGIIKLHKTGEILKSIKENEDGTYTPVFGSADMQGAEFEVSAAEDIITRDGTVRVKKGEVIGELVTDSEGNAKTGLQYLGKFNVVETKAPYGHVLDDMVYTVELAYAGQEVEITDTSVDIDNDRQKAKIRLTKAIEDDELFGMDSNAAYKDIRFGLFAAEEITAADGSVIPEGGLIEVIGVQPAEENGDGENSGEEEFRRMPDTDGEAVGDDEAAADEGSGTSSEDEPIAGGEERQGEATAKYTEYTGEFTADIPLFKLYVQEIAANGQYVLSDTKYPIGFSYQGQDMAVVDIDVNDGEPIENELIRGEIVGYKTGDKGKPLSGAVFGLFRPDEKEFDIEDALMFAETAEDGLFRFTGIPKGDWLIREVASPRGYLLSDEVHKVTVGEDGEAIEINAVNELEPVYVNPPAKTGDESKITLWLTAAIIAAAGVTTAIYGRRKNPIHKK